MVWVEKDGLPGEEPVGLRGTKGSVGGGASAGGRARRALDGQHRSPGQEGQDQGPEMDTGGID